MVAAAPRARTPPPYDFSAGSWIIPMDACYQPSQLVQRLVASRAPTRRRRSTAGTGSCPDGSLTGQGRRAQGLRPRLSPPAEQRARLLHPRHQQERRRRTSISRVTQHDRHAVSLVMHSGSTSNYGNTSEFMKSATSRSATAARRSSSRRPTCRRRSTCCKTNSGVHRQPTRARAAATSRTSRSTRPRSTSCRRRCAPSCQQTPPKIALLDIGGAAIGVLQGYLQDAGLYTGDGDGALPDDRRRLHAVRRRQRLHHVERPHRRRLLDPVGAALGGRLHRSSRAQRDAVIQKITAFIDAGHPFVAQCAAIATLEGANADLERLRHDEPATSYGTSSPMRTGTNVGLQDQPAQPAELPDAAADAIDGQPVDDGAGIYRSADAVGDFSLNNFDSARQLDVRLRARERLPLPVVHQLLRRSRRAHKGCRSRPSATRTATASKGLRHLPRRPQLRQPELDAATARARRRTSTTTSVSSGSSSTRSSSSARCRRRRSRRARRRWSSHGSVDQLQTTYLGSYVQQTSASPPPIRRGRATSASIRPARSAAPTSPASTSITADWDAYDSITGSQAHGRLAHHLHRGAAERQV